MNENTFSKFAAMSHEEMVAARTEIAAKKQAINREIKTLYKQLRKHLAWWFLILFFGLLIYQYLYMRRAAHQTDIMSNISARKYKYAASQLEMEEIYLKVQLDKK